MRSELWRAVSRIWNDAEARIQAPAEYAARLAAAEQIIGICSKLESEVVIRSQDPNARKYVASICKAIQYLALANRDLEILVNPYPTPWLPEVHALHLRVQALIVYEVLDRRSAILGRDLRDGLIGLQLSRFQSELDKVARSYQKFMTGISDFFIASGTRSSLTATSLIRSFRW